MTDLEKRLDAKITAQALVIDEILKSLDRAGLLDAAAIVERLEQFIDTPKADCVDAHEMQEVAAEVEGWADMIYVAYIEDREIDPALSRT
jgi:hypothetical protein